MLIQSGTRKEILTSLVFILSAKKPHKNMQIVKMRIKSIFQDENEKGLLCTPYWQDLETADGQTLLCSVLELYKM